MSRQSLIAINTRETSSTKQHDIGTKYEDEFGNIYRYIKNAAVELAPGKIIVNADSDSDATNVKVARTYAAGAKEIIIDAGNAVASDAFADGTLTVNDATGEGVTVVVAGNTVTTGAAEMTVTLKQPIPVALTIDVSEVTLQKNPWDSPVISIADQADMPVGVPNVTIPANYYGWVQTRGTCSVLFDEAVAKGLALTIGSSTVGAVEAADAAGEPVLGVAQMAGVDTEYQPAFLTID
jgi:hypothetical protein